MSGGRALGSDDLLSLSRPVLGVVVLAEMLRASSSWLVLPLTALACLTDYWDGVLARKHGTATIRGRFIDNICDAAFLALAFAGFAVQAVWSHPVTGSATRYSDHANWLPLYALAVSFGLYLLRSVYCLRASVPVEPSMRGHTAGVSNYVLAVIGAVAVLPGVWLTPWLLEPAFVTVALLNASAAGDNLVLLVRSRMSRSSGGR